MTSKTPSPRMNPSSRTGIDASSAGVVRPSRQASSAVETSPTIGAFSHARLVARRIVRHTLPRMTEQTGPPPAAGRRRPAWLPPLAGWLIAIAGLLIVAFALTPKLAERPREFMHFYAADIVTIVN